jgi:hypothetical protein
MVEDVIDYANHPSAIPLEANGVLELDIDVN